MGQLNTTSHSYRFTDTTLLSMIYILYLFLILNCLHTSVAQNCCPTKKVVGSDPLAGTYSLFNGQANFLPVCMDQCAYKKEGNADPNELFCFKTDGATHDTECLAGTTPSSSGGSGTCPYTKDNVSWGEYQTKIGMDTGTSAPYTVVITFDSVTTIGGCHSNCKDGSGNDKPSCTGKICTVTYTGSTPLDMFNIKKDNPAGDNDRSNMVSVTINGIEQC